MPRAYPSEQRRAGRRVKAAAKREMKGYAVGELRIPQLYNDGFGRELIGLKLEDGLKREGTARYLTVAIRTASTRFARA